MTSLRLACALRAVAILFSHASQGLDAACAREAARDMAASLLLALQENSLAAGNLVEVGRRMFTCGPKCSDAAGSMRTASASVA